MLTLNIAIRRMVLTVGAVAVGLLGPAASAQAEVTRIEVVQRAPLAKTGYEKLVGKVHFAIDPKNPRNAVIADLDRAAKNAGGRVEFSSDFFVLRPAAGTRSNGVALVEVVNRGRKLMLSTFARSSANLDLTTEADLGDGFLTRDGFTLAWVGWQFDTRSENGLLGMRAPVTSNHSVVVRAEFTPNDRGPAMTVADLAGYPPVDIGGPDTQLTVRDDIYAAAKTVDRAAYQVSGNIVTMRDGFEAGRIYTIAYRTANPPVVGAGLAAFRDFAAWLKRGTGESPRVKYAYAWGSSQSGRFLRSFLYHGFNADESGAQVFDAVMAHIAGGARLSLNEPGATPNALSMFTATAFPYANQSTTDPISGRAEGLVDNERARATAPKTIYTNSAVEYWGGGRSAALIHAAPDGKSDLVLPDNERVYLLSGTQHSPARFPPRTTQGQQPENPAEYAWTLRALMTALNQWVRSGKTPPPSQYPRLADGTLVAADKVAFPAIPNVPSPKSIPAVRAKDRAVPFLVPQVDADGNELAGVRTPEILTPVATYTGWNFRTAQIGGTHLPVSLMGSAIPFARTAAAKRKGDPRRTIEERYPTRAAYDKAIRAAVDQLVAGGYLLQDDVPQVLRRADAQWAQATGAPQPAPINTASQVR